MVELGQPDLKVAGLSLWVHDRQFPDTSDYWDANWLFVSMKCVAAGAAVEVNGPLIFITEIEQFQVEIGNILNGSGSSAQLECMEPNLHISIEKKDARIFEMTVLITPDNLMQKHSFKFEIDQSHIDQCNSACRRILRDFPIIGSP